MNRRMLLSFVLLVVGAESVVVGADMPIGVGQRLTPPKQVEVPALPSAATPVVRTPRPVDRVPGLLWSLPTVELPKRPATLDRELSKPTWQHTAYDAPPIAMDAVPAPPSPVVMPTVQRSHVVAESPRNAPALPRFARDNEPLPKATDDPSSESAFRFLVQPQLVVAPAPPPPLKLFVPDPDAPLRSLQLGTADVEPTGPVSIRELPPRAALPVK